MNCPNPANLAVLACPGGEVFADEVIAHLKKGYRHSFDTAIAELAKHYGIETGAAVRQVNFINDVLSPPLRMPDSPDRYRIPRFKVPAKFTLFPNGEIKSEILESVRGKDLYIIQDVENRSPVKFNNGETKKVLTVNDHLLTIFVTVDAAMQAGAGRVTLVVPVYPYARQDKKKGREGLTAGRVGKTFERLGVNRIITLDIHSREIENAFDNMRLENLHASYQVTRALSLIPGFINDNLVVLSPDTGAADRNNFYATALKKPLALLYKVRDYSKVSKDALENNITELKLLGDIKGKTIFMADDRLDSGGTLLEELKFLKTMDVGKIVCSISLPVFTKDAIKHFDEAYNEGLFYRIIGTNAVYQEELLKREWYISVNITKLFAQTISRLHQGLSVSSLLDNRNMIEQLFNEPQPPKAN